LFGEVPEVRRNARGAMALRLTSMSQKAEQP
jgi:hypothetical protein